MLLKFLGTAAAEGFPAIFCDCRNCRAARALGGKNIRLRSALLVNNDLLIDCGPDLSTSAQQLNLSLWGVQTGLVTHAHADHFHPHNFEMRGASFTNHHQPPTLTLFCPPDAAAILQKAFSSLEELRLEPRAVGPFETWTHNGYGISSYRAYHAVGSYDCLFYSVDDGKNGFLYATDTGDFPAETWQALSGRSFDAIILEETLGDGQYSQHMNFERFLQHCERFRKEGMLRPGGQIIAHHFSHSGNPVHEELVERFAPYGVEVAYDGLEVLL